MSERRPRMNEHREGLAEARPTHHMHEGDTYGVVPGPAHTCITSVKAESVFVLTVEERARMLADAWDQGHRTYQQLGPDDCRCEAWNADECGCGEYGSNIITPNPYRAEAR